MVEYNLLKFPFIRIFHNEIFFGTEKLDCVRKTKPMFSFLLLMNNSVTIGLSFLLLIISVIISSNTINT